jgi:hypothetical protein
MDSLISLNSVIPLVKCPDLNEGAWLLADPERPRPSQIRVHIRAPSSVPPHPCPPIRVPTSVPIQIICHNCLDALYAYTSGSSSSRPGGKVYGTLSVENNEPSWLTWLGSPACYRFAQLTVCACAEYID